MAATFWNNNVAKIGQHRPKLTDFKTSLGYLFTFFRSWNTPENEYSKKWDFFKNSLIIKKILKNAFFWAIAVFKFLSAQKSLVGFKFFPKWKLAGSSSALTAL
jgi:hypothetical protein